MSRKKKKFTNNAVKRQKNEINRTVDPGIFLLENKIISLLDSTDQAVSKQQLTLTFTGRTEKKQLQKALANLSKGNFIRFFRSGYILTDNNSLFRGTLNQTQGGFGFVSVEGKRHRTGQKDPYIPSKEMHGAIHGDKVLVRPLFRDRKSGYTVVRVIKAAANVLCGILRERRGKFLVIPDNQHIPFRLEIATTDLAGARPGDAVRVEFQRQNAKGRTLPGKILSIIGSPALIDTQMQLTIEQFQLPVRFSRTAKSYAQKLTMQNSGTLPRKDLRKTKHITIDGSTAKDFDDAIFLEQRNNNTLRLYVSIADVSHFVKKGTALDNEAYQRGTSVYFPGRVIPMLPEKLSNDLCSLVPGEDRYTITAQLDFNTSGELVRTEFYPSIIRSKQRFSYTEIATLLKGGKNLSERDAEFLPMLQIMQNLTEKLRKKRLARGAIDFNFQEAVFTLDNKGDVTAIKPAKRNLAHKLIEECMLIANEAVAKFLAGKIIAPVYRIHDQPSATKIEELQAITKMLKIKLPRYHKESAWFTEVLQQTQGTRYEYIINNLLLRSLTQAKYATSQTGHFGLATDTYTHFTSPIRRYPDLIVHRMLIAALKTKQKKSRKKKFAPQPTKEAASFLSCRERTAVDAERDMNDRLKVLFMKNKIGETFVATISGVSENALFVELADPMVSGAIPVELLGGEYFYYDSQKVRLFGEITKKQYQLGDRIRVTLVSVNMGRRQLTFQPEEDLT